MYEETSKTAHWRRKHACMLSERESQHWNSRWKEVTEYFDEDRGRYLDGVNSTQHNNGERRDSLIINPAGGDAALVCINGLNSGLTPHWSPWFNFTLPDEDLVEYTPVRQWLHDSRNVILTILSKSNFYSSIYDVYGEVTNFATASMIIDEDLKDSFIRCRTLTVGEYCLGLDSSYRPAELYRQFVMTAAQIKEKFGKGKDGLDGLPLEVLDALRTKRYDQAFEVVHVIEKNNFCHPARADYKSFQFSSIYYPLNGDQNVVLRENGYRKIPFIAPRWKSVGTNAYGSGCPAFRRIGDVRQLQQLERDYLEALRKVIRPPMNAPVSMENRGGNILAGGINFLDPNSGTQGFTPAYQIDPRLHEVQQKIQLVVQQIQDGFFNRFFLAVMGMEKREVTAYEIAKRYEEKATFLGPIMEKMDSELRNPVIERVFDIAAYNGWLPPPPPELPANMELKVEYTSSLSQAQRMVQGQPVQEFMAVIGNMMQLFPDTKHKVNAMEAVDQLGLGYNLPPKIVRSDDEVEQLIAQDQKKQALMQAAQMAPGIAQSVKALGDTPYKDGETTALDGLMNARNR